MRKFRDNNKNVNRRSMKVMLAILSAAAVLGLSACGGKDAEGQQTETEASQAAGGTTVDPAYAAMAGEIAALDPEMPDSLGTAEIGEYRGLSVETTAADEVTEDDALSFIEVNVLPYYLGETDEPADYGDTVNIDYSGSVDGEKFEGGTAEAQTLVLGNGGYIDGFEDGMIGMKAGETKDINVTFPEDYNEELAGKDAVFTITMNSVQRQRELDDELASELNASCATREEYIAFVKDELQKQADSDAEFTLYDNAVRAAMDNCRVLEPSEEAVDWRIEERLIYHDDMLRSAYGLGLADYLSMSGVNLDDYRESIRESCADEARQYLLTETICEAEGLEATEENLAEWAEMNGVDMETVNETYDEDEAAVRCRAWLAARLIAEDATVSYVEADEASVG